MSVFEKEVLKIGTRTKGKNSWKVITTKAKDGKERDENLIISGDPDLQERISSVFDSPGKYEIEYEKREDFWVPIGAKKIGGASSSAEKHQKGQETPNMASYSTPPAESPNVAIAVGSLRATGTIISALVTSGMFKDAGVDSVKGFALEVLDSLTKGAKNSISGKSAEGA